MNNNNKKRCTELIKSPKSMLMNRRANLLRVICPPKRSHVIFFCSGAELNLHLSQPTVLICSSYISNPLFVFPLPASTWKKKTKKKQPRCMSMLKRGLLMQFCSVRKTPAAISLPSAPEAQRYLKPSAPLIDTHDAFFFFFFLTRSEPIATMHT